MPEMRGSDLVVEYLIREQVPYLFGYAGHGAVGLLDGVHDRQDEIKVVFPRIETGAGYMADAYYRASGQVIPVYTSTGPGPDAAHGGDLERLLRLLGVHRDHRPGSDEPVRLGRAPGGVPPPPGRLPEHRQGDHEAQLPGALGRGHLEVPPEGVQARPARAVRAPYTSTSPTTSGCAPADVEVPEPEEHSSMLNWRTPGLARGRREGARPASPRPPSARSWPEAASSAPTRASSSPRSRST